MNYNLYVNYNLPVNYNSLMNYNLHVNYSLLMNYNLSINYSVLINYNLSINYSVLINYNLSINYSVLINYSLPIAHYEKSKFSQNCPIVYRLIDATVIGFFHKVLMLMELTYSLANIGRVFSYWQIFFIRLTEWTMFVCVAHLNRLKTSNYVP